MDSIKLREPDSHSSFVTETVNNYICLDLDRRITKSVFFFFIVLKLFYFCSSIVPTRYCINKKTEKLNGLTSKRCFIYQLRKLQCALHSPVGHNDCFDRLPNPFYRMILYMCYTSFQIRHNGLNCRSD